MLVRIIADSSHCFRSLLSLLIKQNIELLFNLCHNASALLMALVENYELYSLSRMNALPVVG